MAFIERRILICATSSRYARVLPTVSSVRPAPSAGRICVGGQLNGMQRWPEAANLVQPSTRGAGTTSDLLGFGRPCECCQSVDQPVVAGFSSFRYVSSHPLCTQEVTGSSPVGSTHESPAIRRHSWIEPPKGAAAELFMEASWKPLARTRRQRGESLGADTY